MEAVFADAAAAQKPIAVAEMATKARVRIFFFIVLYPYSCRAQLLSFTCYALYAKMRKFVTLSSNIFFVRCNKSTGSLSNILSSP